MKTIVQQAHAMRQLWPSFDVAGQTTDRAVWFGPLAGIERIYRVMIEYGLPIQESESDLFRTLPLTCPP